MESEVLKKIHRRTIKSLMDILILTELRNGPMSGYDAIAFVHNKFGILVSSGTVYSLLYSLERDGVIKDLWAKRKRVYELIEKGERSFKPYSTPTIKSKVDNKPPLNSLKHQFPTANA